MRSPTPADRELGEVTGAADAELHEITGAADRELGEIAGAADRELTELPPQLAGVVVERLTQAGERYWLIGDRFRRDVLQGVRR